MINCGEPGAQGLCAEAVAVIDVTTSASANNVNRRHVFDMLALSSRASTVYAVLIQTALTLRYSSRCWRPDSRPYPLILQPPNGTAGSIAWEQLTHTDPARIP